MNIFFNFFCFNDRFFTSLLIFYFIFLGKFLIIVIFFRNQGNHAATKMFFVLHITFFTNPSLKQNNQHNQANVTKDWIHDRNQLFKTKEVQDITTEVKKKYENF